MLKVRGVLVRYLDEAPMAQGQRMRPLDDEWHEVRVHIKDTVMLRNWLRSLGPDAVVLAPAALRKVMRSEALMLGALYSKPE